MDEAPQNSTDEAPEPALPAPAARAANALDRLLAHYADRIAELRRAAAPDAERLGRLLAERQELLTDKDLLADLTEEQLVQVAAIYETRNDTLDSTQPDVR
ncbi:hypothetical protein [Streptomyces sp. NPDC006552]|uniref:hypothetical protein n=1 Tax=Streptomyces sp. NPDC006552 TaxID=3157179 RepID=UPI0033AF960A